MKISAVERLIFNNDVNEIFPVCSKFFFRFVCKSIQEMYVKMYCEVVSSMQIGARNSVNSLWA